MRTLSLFGMLAITLSLAGCAKDDEGDDAPANPSTGIEIAGTWTSEFGEEVIADESWSSGDTVAVVADFSNSENVAVTQNSDDADFAPGKFNRIVWTEPTGGSFFYCTTDFGLDSEEDARSASTMPDDTDPAVSGCGGMFPWTKLTRK